MYKRILDKKVHTLKNLKLILFEERSALKIDNSNAFTRYVDQETRYIRFFTRLNNLQKKVNKFSHDDKQAIIIEKKIAQMFKQIISLKDEINNLAEVKKIDLKMNIIRTNIRKDLNNFY